MTIDAELNRKFPLAIDLKQNIARLTQVGNESRGARYTINTTYIRSKCSRGTA